ncbi:MAG: methyltransferase, TrmH family [Nocardioidaceae bacterium]|nr:methyltransferase, TrmH family [Nocardioidaceae bacterium]
MTPYDDLPPAPGRTNEITSPANPRVKWLTGLRRRRARDDEGVTVVDGYDEIRLALEAGVELRALYYSPSLVADRSRLGLVDALSARGVEVVRLGSTAFTRASYRESPDGWLAVVPNPARELSALALSERPLLLIAASIEKPGNLGAMLRTAEAAGLDAVIAAAAVTDWGNPNVIRASKGTVFAVPVAAATTHETIGWLRDNGLTIVAASPEAATVVSDVDLTGGVAVVVGAEHEGLSSAWRVAADHAVRIPMVGRVNSLNVATSAAVVLYEAARQRALTGAGGRVTG